MTSLRFCADTRDVLEAALQEQGNSYAVLYPTLKREKSEPMGVTEASVDDEKSEKKSLVMSLFGTFEVPNTISSSAFMPIFRAMAVNAALYCKQKKIKILILPAALLNICSFNLENEDDCILLEATLSEVLAPYDINVIVTAKVIEDDRLAMKDVGFNYERYIELKDKELNEYCKDASKKARKKDKKKGKKKKKH